MEGMPARAGAKGVEEDRTGGWPIVGLLFLFMLINFADRAVLGLAATPIMQELALSHTQFGLIGASFFMFFSVGALIGGFVVNRVATKWVLAGLALFWSLCQLPILLTVTATALVANRVALGFGEGPAYPIAVHAAYKWFQNERRALPTSLIAIGALAGSGIIAPVIVLVITAWSWQTAFGLLGAASLVWCAAWLTIAREGPLDAGRSLARVAGVQQGRLSYRRLLSCRTVIGVLIVGFSAYWLLTLAIVWLPTLLTQSFGYTAIQAGWIMMLISLCQIMILPTVSSFSDHLKQRGVSSRIACGAVACVGTLAAGMIVVLLSQSVGSAAILLCTVAAFSLANLISVLGPVLIAEVTPIRQRGAALGIVNAVTTLAGPLAPIATGLMIDIGIGANAADGGRGALLMSGLLVILSALAGLVLIDPDNDRVRLSLKHQACS